MNLKNLFSSVNRRLSNIERYNNTPRNHKESVAEHSYFVTFYVMILSNYIKKIDSSKAMKLALIHDIEEVISGDFPHSIKLKYPSFESSLDSMNLLIINEIFSENEYIDLWKEARESKTKESKLVNFADRLAGYLYTKDELLMGNQFMKDIHLEQEKYLREFIQNNSEYQEIGKELGLCK